MAKALKEVQASLNYNLKLSQEGFVGMQMKLLSNCIKKGLEIYQKDQPRIMRYINELRRISKIIHTKK